MSQTRRIIDRCKYYALFNSLKLLKSTSSLKRTPLQSALKSISQKEASVIEGLKSIEKSSPKALTDGTALWEEDNGLVYYKGKLYVPNDRGLRCNVVKSCHDTVTTGHPGKNGTIELVSHYYWWPCMGSFITAYIDGCDCCQRYRRDIHPTVPLQPNEVHEGLWQIVGVD